MEIRGKTKITFDRINEPVKKWGMSSLSLVAFIAVMLIVVAILLFIHVISAVIFICIYIFSFLKYSKWLIKNKKKGINNPFLDNLEYLGTPKYYEQNLDYKNIYKK